MKTIQNAILEIGGLTSGDEYRAICLAIYEARNQQPDMPQMKELSASIQEKMHKKNASSVLKALERAVVDLWTKGNRDVMASYQRCWEIDQPRAKDFVCVMAQRLWDGKDRRNEHTQ